MINIVLIKPVADANCSINKFLTKIQFYRFKKQSKMIKKL